MVCFDGQNLSQAPLSSFIIMDVNMVSETLTGSTKGDFFLMQPDKFSIQRELENVLFHCTVA